MESERLPITIYKPGDFSRQDWAKMASTIESMKIEVSFTNYSRTTKIVSFSAQVSFIFQEDNMFWFIFGEENDIYPLTATLSINTPDPTHPNVNLTQSVQWVGMDGSPQAL